MTYRQYFKSSIAEVVPIVFESLMLKARAVDGCSNYNLVPVISVFLSCGEEKQLQSNLPYNLTPLLLCIHPSLRTTEH